MKSFFLSLSLSPHGKLHYPIMSWTWQSVPVLFTPISPQATTTTSPRPGTSTVGFTRTQWWWDAMRIFDTSWDVRGNTGRRAAE